MKGPELAKKLHALAESVKSHGRVDGLDLSDETLTVRVPSVGALRQRKYKASPKASPSDGGADASPVTESVTARRSRSISHSVSPSVTRSVIPSRPSLGSLPDLPEKDPKESVVAPKDLTGFPRDPEATTAGKIMTGPAESASGDGAAGFPQARDSSAGLGRPARPRNHAEALSEPAGALAELCRSDALYASLIEVHRMPWVVEPIRAWHEAGGDTRPLNLESNDGEVRAIVELTARGYLKSDLVRVARHLRGTPKYADRVLASCMTKAVVEIALSELRDAPSRSAWAEGMVRRADASARQPEALAGVLAKVAGGGGE